jgi:hypothetical protein
VQQDETYISQGVKMPRLGNPNLFAKQEEKKAPCVDPNHHPSISVRYSTRELLTIFKSLGRF